MAEKRQRDDAASRGPSKKQKHGAKRHKGFQVGPANLPDGTYKRKVQQIKKNLIHKAKLKKEYAKIKERELHHHPNSRPTFDRDASEDPATAAPASEPASLDPHPDRLQNLEQSPSPPPPTSNSSRDHSHPHRRPHNPRAAPFHKEAAAAQQRREEAEARRKAHEEAQRQKQERLAERERARKAMARARGAKDGKRRLGREGPVLLERVRKMMGQ